MAGCNATAACVALRRGSEVMVLFRGCPHPSALLSLEKLQIAVGVALSPDELQAIHRLDCYDYVFLAARLQAASALKLAVADLARGNWSIDDTKAWVYTAMNQWSPGYRAG